MEQVIEIWGMIPAEFKNVTAIIGILSIVAAVTPTPVDNAILIAVKKVLDLGGFNFLSAENKTKPGQKKSVDAE